MLPIKNGLFALLLIFTPFLCWSQCDLQSNLKIHYSFNNNALDAITGNSAQLKNGIQFTEDRFGIPNQAIYLNGIDQHVIIPHDEIFNTVPFTVSFWFYKENDIIDNTSGTTNNVEGLLFKGYDTNEGGRTFSFELEELTAPFDMTFSTLITPPNSSQARAEKIINPKQWYNIVGVFSESIMSLYLNGELVATYENDGITDPRMEDLLIGAVPFDGIGNLFNTRFFQGKFDDLRFYDKVLTAEEIQSLQGCSLDCGLEVLYTFDHTTNDSQSNNTAQFVNGVQYTTDRFNNPDQAIYLNGIDQHVIIPHNDIFNTHPFSISFWFYKENDIIDHTSGTINNVEGLLFKGYDTHEGGRTFSFELEELTAPFDITFSTVIAPPNSNQARKEKTINPQQWYNIIGVFNGTTMSLYLDGELVSTYETEGATVPRMEDLLIGAVPSDGVNNLFSTRFFQGKFDDLRFYSREVNNNEINALQENGCLKECPLNAFISTIEQNVYSVTNTIESTAIITENSHITFNAEGEVNLNPGFHAKHGSEFYATIDDCENLESFKDDTPNVFLDKKHKRNLNQTDNTKKSSKYLNIIPNPVKNTAVIEYSTAYAEIVHLRLFNLEGKLIKYWSNTSNNVGKHQVNISRDNIPNGLYILQLTSMDRNISKKIIFN